MTTMTRLQALPQALCNDERNWYRGLTAIDQIVVPVVKPEGFLSPDELFALDSLVDPALTPTGENTDASALASALSTDANLDSTSSIQ